MLKNIKNKIILSVSTALASAAPALAEVQAGNIKNAFNDATTKFKDVIDPIINLILMIVGVIAIAVAVWAYLKKRKGDPNANDGIIDAAWTTLAVVAFIYVIKSVFF